MQVLCSFCHVLQQSVIIFVKNCIWTYVQMYMYMLYTVMCNIHVLHRALTCLCPYAIQLTQSYLLVPYQDAHICTCMYVRPISMQILFPKTFKVHCTCSLKQTPPL